MWHGPSVSEALEKGVDKVGQGARMLVVIC